MYELLQASAGESERVEGAPSGRRKAQFFLGSTNKRAKTVVLHITGLDDSVSSPRNKQRLHSKIWGIHVIAMILTNITIVI